VVDLLVSAGCPDVILAGGGSGGTLPRRRGSVSSSARAKEVNSSIL